MANFIISPYAISYTNIKNALQKYINDKNVSNVLDTWSDFYTAGAGQTIIELDAAVASFYAFHFLVGRREAYLPVAQNYSSILGGAETLGYCASRGHNVHLKLTFTPNQTVTLPKWTVLGTLSEYDIILLDTVTLNKDVEISVDVVIGNLAAQSIQITSNTLQQFTFTAEDSTDDCRLILNQTEVPVATNLEEAMDDKYIILSNSYGAVDVFYLNQGNNHITYSVTKGTEHGWTTTKGEAGEIVPKNAFIFKDLVQSRSLVNTGDFTYTGSTHESNYTYSTQDILYFQYVQRNNLKYNKISKSNMTLDYGELLDIDLIEDFKDVQDKESIKLAASIAHENNNVIRARKDYAKYLLQDNTLNLVDANDLDINPGLIAITYLKKVDDTGNNLLTTYEKETYMEKVVKACPDGVANIYVEDPIPVVRHLQITLQQKTGENIPSNIHTYIQNILTEYENQLAVSLDLEELEHALEQIPGVKIARADIGVSDYELDTDYKLYDVVTVSDILVGTEYQTWKMLCTNIQTSSGTEEPDWSSANAYGETVADSDLLWEKTNKYVSSIPYRWKAGENFNLYQDVAVGYNIYPNCTSYTEPEWDKTTIIDGNVTFNKVKTYDYKLRDFEENTSFVMNEYVQFENGADRAVYYVSNLLHKSSETSPSWSEAIEENDKVSDNALTWRLEYLGYNSSQNYKAGDLVASVSGNTIYVYKATDTITSETKYYPTDQTGDIANPLDGTENIYNMRDAEYYDDEEDTWKTKRVQDKIVWALYDTLELTEWAADTEFDLDVYVQGNNNIFRCIANTNSTSGKTWFTVASPKTVTDNNIVWTRDEYSIGLNDYPVLGTSWKANTEYKKDDLIIVSNNEYNYVYRVAHVNNNTIATNNVIYSVTNYTGISGETEPTWVFTKTEGGEEVSYPNNTVVDNGILWTNTTNPATKTWEANTRYNIGDIISTENGNFVFASLIGHSGKEYPNWVGINNGVVTDNNITWQRLDDSTIITLKWNEYLKLTYDLEKIV